MAIEEVNVATKRGSVLNGVIFSSDKNDKSTLVIAITGIHGNFYSNPFYVNIGKTLSDNGIDFLYAQTADAFGEMETYNVNTKEKEIIGSGTEDFNNTDEDIEAYLNFARQNGYQSVILAGHSLGANKVIYYLSRHHDSYVKHFIFLSPANLEHLTSVVSPEQRQFIQQEKMSGHGKERLPFQLLGWIPSTVDNAYQWVFQNILNNVHVEEDKDFSQVAAVSQSGALVIGTLDRFTYGDPTHFLNTINNHMKKKDENKLIYIQETGHTYQQKEQEIADQLLNLIQTWKKEEE